MAEELTSQIICVANIKLTFAIGKTSASTLPTRLKLLASTFTTNTKEYK